MELLSGGVLRTKGEEGERGHASFFFFFGTWERAAYERNENQHKNEMGKNLLYIGMRLLRSAWYLS